MRVVHLFEENLDREDALHAMQLMAKFLTKKLGEEYKVFDRDQGSGKPLPVMLIEVKPAVNYMAASTDSSAGRSAHISRGADKWEVVIYEGRRRSQTLLHKFKVDTDKEAVDTAVEYVKKFDVNKPYVGSFRAEDADE
jgi:hypothetical protein